ncbi:FKBP-type peptidyl-prolyl cis-trans isomerase [Pseudoduganella sp. FT25W]|uniref:Peptidyl-prolyl cis-trans isomerase n=1 Tax=Duganella alba TaxID=2666081 RepID=A0A6L5QF94_9BURK|nr:FKBP-type peptidyl-prolyl cis-trans isomerase [Duganella alba]MRX08433.1 FKBP-type peptidyl-prolyl cis-trans isomerase [Duganella alba]MRX17093.1 FKBP-type peptidyl-prolyl cis-trans isomerase [Duganella alba]
MKLKSSLIAACVVLSTLTACGGGGGSSGSNGSVTTPADNPGSFSQTDSAVGTGMLASTTNIVGIRYSAWLYSASAADHKGAKIDTNLTSATPYVFTLGGGVVIKGLEQGVTGMKVGGQRTLIIPASLALGASGSTTVPPNAGMVFDVQLTDVQALAEAPAFGVTDTVVGTGATAAVGATANVKYSAYLYSSVATDHKGILVDTNATATTNFSFKLGAGNVIKGFDQGVTGMKVGGKRSIIMPSTLAYGSTGSGAIPANSGMVFAIELISIQ